MEYLFAIGCVGLGWLLGILSELAREFFNRKFCGPSVSVSSTSKEGYLLHTANRTFLRLYLENRGYLTAVGCKGFLVLCEKSRSNGYEKVHGGDDTLLLTWAYSKAEERASGFDMPRGVGRYLDLLYVDQGQQSFHLRHVSPEPPAIEGIGVRGQYRFTIMISAEKTEPKLAQVVFNWTGDWETSEISVQRTIDKTNLRSQHRAAPREKNTCTARADLPEVLP